MNPARAAATATGLLAAAALAATATAPARPPAVAPEPRLEAPLPSLFALGPALRLRSTPLGAEGIRRLAAAGWWGGTYPTASGPVTVFVSDAYAQDAAVAQAWADFFASLVHGPELASLRAYVATLAEVEEELCGGGPGVLGCYWGDRLVTVGDSEGGIAPAAVAAHEYGHHVAANRLNSPWPAADWGTKRWASYVGVCRRAESGTAFPGSQTLYYTLNPGEAFAESYRVLNDRRTGATAFDWPIVDPSFFPDERALARVEEDVLHPWAGPTRNILRRVPARTQRTWTLRVPTTLDGTLRVTLRSPRGAYELALLAPDDRRVLQRGLWTASGVQSLEHRVCGERSAIVRVTRAGGAPAPFSVRVTAP